MFNKLRKLLVKDGIRTPEYQQIFNNVIGYDDIKLLLYKMITSKYTNSVLLTGPPASSKTVFILDLLDHFKVKAYLVDGTTASGMGIIDYLFDHTDLKFLLIDEIDKLSKKDQKVLLNVMETGILSDVKAKSSKSARQTHMHLSIYATSNDTSNLLTIQIYHPNTVIGYYLVSMIKTMKEYRRSSDTYGNILKMYERQ
jgi:Cdc6-like AAA superfamily ATPase